MTDWSPYGLILTPEIAAELDAVRREIGSHLPPLAHVELIDEEPDDDPQSAMVGRPLDPNRCEHYAHRIAQRDQRERAIREACEAITAMGGRPRPFVVADMTGTSEGYTRRVMERLGLRTAQYTRGRSLCPRRKGVSA